MTIQDIKIGARNRAADVKIAREAKQKTRDVLQAFEDLGYADEPAPLEWTAPAEPEKALVNFGAQVKALGDGKVGGYLVRFTDANSPDLSGDYFTAQTDFGEHDSVPVLYQHGMDDTIKGRVLGRGKLAKDDVGVWVEAQLNLRDEYEKAIYQLAEQGKLGWSSGTAGHLVEREMTGKAAFIKTWPLGLDASLTPTPAEPRNAAITLKAYADSLTPAEQPAPNGAHDQPALPVSTPIIQPEKKTMENQLAQEQFDKLLAGMTSVMESVKGIRTDVDAMKAEPPIKTAGVAGILESGKAPAYNQLPRESLADEQLSALKSYLRDEIGKDDWKKHNQQVAYHERDAVKSFQELTHTPAPQNMYALANYQTKATLVEGTASLGGALVPTLYSNQVVGVLKEMSVVRRAGAYQFPVSGTNLFQVPKITRSGSAPIATEQGAASQMEPTFDTQNFTAYAYRAQYKATREQVIDSRIPLDSLLMDNAAWQLTQSENNHFVIGTGSGQPQGIAVAASTLAVSPGSTLALAFTSAGASNIFEAYHGLPYQYRDNAVWFAADTTVKALRQIRNSAASLGEYLWGQPGMQAGSPLTLLGRPVVTCNNMATSGSTANVLVFADPRFFWIADFNNGGLDFQILNELYAASAAIGWWFWRRMDSHLMVSEAAVGIKLLS